MRVECRMVKWIYVAEGGVHLHVFVMVLSFREFIETGNLFSS
jgi:hypothetical protein